MMLDVEQEPEPREVSREAANRLVLEKRHLAAGSRADEPLAVLRDLVGLHATDPVSPYLQLRARMKPFESAQLEGLPRAGAPIGPTGRPALDFFRSRRHRCARRERGDDWEHHEDR